MLSRQSMQVLAAQAVMGLVRAQNYNWGGGL
jgi:hypothetical protein